MTTPAASSPAERAKTSLENVENGLAAAHKSTAAALEKAKDVARTANLQRFETVARSVLAVARKLEEVSRAITAENGKMRSAREAVAGVPKGASPEEIANRLGPARQTLADGPTRIAGIITLVRDAASSATAALRGGQPGPLVAAINQIRERLTPTHAQVQDAHQHVEAAIKGARSTGN